MEVVIGLIVIWIVGGFAWGFVKHFNSPESKNLRRLLKESGELSKSTDALIAKVNANRNPVEEQRRATERTNESIAIRQEIALAFARMTPDEQEQFQAQEDAAFDAHEREMEEMYNRGSVIPGREFEQLDEAYERHFQHRRAIIPTGRLM